MRRRSDDYDLDESSRYDGDDDNSYSSRFNRPEWLAIVAEQEAGKQAAFDADAARYAKPRPACATERHCPTCRGTGILKASPDTDACCDCYTCGGHGVIA